MSEQLSQVAYQPERYVRRTSRSASPTIARPTTVTAAAAMRPAPEPSLPAGAGDGESAAATGDGEGETASVAAAVVDGLGDVLGDGASLVGAADGAAVGAGVGGFVGAGVRATVGSGVDGGGGGGVDGGGGGGVGVGCGVAAACTTIVPFMNEWIAQWYRNVPALVKVIDFAAFATITPVSHAPVSDVAVWLNASAFVQVTVSPTRIDVVGGLNDESWIVTALVAAIATKGVASSAAENASAAAHTTARLIAILDGAWREFPRRRRMRRSHAMRSASGSTSIPSASLSAPGTPSSSSNAIRR